MTVHRYVVPIDNKVHHVELTRIATVTEMATVLYGPGEGGHLEFWAPYDSDAEKVTRRFRVYGTGDPIDGEIVYWGTAPRVSSGAVFHLIEHI